MAHRQRNDLYDYHDHDIDDRDIDNDNDMDNDHDQDLDLDEAPSSTAGGSTPVKRKRLTQACDPCRKKKIKCGKRRRKPWAEGLNNSTDRPFGPPPLPCLLTDPKLSCVRSLYHYQYRSP